MTTREDGIRSGGISGPSDDSGASRISPARAWIMASRPKTLTAAIAPVLTGIGLAAFHGVLVWLPAGAAMLGAVLIQIGTNLANDYYDFVRGGDTDERIGPVRVTQAGILPPAAVLRGTIVVLAAATLVGAYLVSVAGWPIVWIGVTSIACAVLYTGGPFPLAYHGLGDVFVFIFFGLVAVGGTYYVQALEWPGDAILAGVGLGALNTAILVVNNLRDIETDTKAGKRTMAVRLGERGTRAQYVLMLLIAAVAPIAGVVMYDWPLAVLLSLGFAPLCARPLRTVLTFHDPRELLPALGGTARVVVVYGGLLAIGLAFG
jgi:1,4-dihydroxy-2-naphthoate polyprenyltransferase